MLEEPMSGSTGIISPARAVFKQELTCDDKGNPLRWTMDLGGWSEEQLALAVSQCTIQASTELDVVLNECPLFNLAAFPSLALSCQRSDEQTGRSSDEQTGSSGLLGRQITDGSAGPSDYRRPEEDGIVIESGQCIEAESQDEENQPQVPQVKMKTSEGRAGAHKGSSTRKNVHLFLWPGASVPPIQEDMLCIQEDPCTQSDGKYNTSRLRAKKKTKCACGHVSYLSLGKCEGCDEELCYRCRRRLGDIFALQNMS